MKDAKVSVFRVFVNSEGKFGNPVGIIVDEKGDIPKTDRQEIAAKLNFSETVFIDDSSRGKVQMFNPIHEVSFAGHALVGTAHYINTVLHKKVDSLECKAGRVFTWQENNSTWIRASLENTPPWIYKQLPDSINVESLTAKEMSNNEHVVVWAWIDQEKGIIRARTFAPDWGIPEDEANGSGSMQLAASLGIKIEIRHGKGSIIYASPEKNNSANVGGRISGV